MQQQLLCSVWPARSGTQISVSGNACVEPTIFIIVERIKLITVPSLRVITFFSCLGQCIDPCMTMCGFSGTWWFTLHFNGTEVCDSACVGSEQRGGSIRDLRALLGGGRGSQLLWRDAEGARPVGDLLRPDSGLHPGAHHPVAAAGPSHPMQTPFRGDNRRVLAGPPPHQVTETE